MFYYKADLIYTYEWETGEDDPRLRGEPDHSLFNRRQGWEVLYLINKFGAEYHIELKSAGEKIEKMINKYLPSDVRSQLLVKAWLVENWSSY